MLFNLFKNKKENKKKDGEKYIKEIKINEQGQKEVYVEGWKYPIKGTPRQDFLVKTLDPIKHKIDDIILDFGWKLISNGVPDQQYCESVKEIARLFDLMSEAEELEGMKKKWQRYKRTLCAFLQEDDAYRLRFLWALSRADLKKFKMGKDDLWWLSKKGFNVNVK